MHSAQTSVVNLPIVPETLLSHDPAGPVLCLLQPAEGRNGVGIFVSCSVLLFTRDSFSLSTIQGPVDIPCRRYSDCERYRTSFDVWVRIPIQVSEEDPLVIKKFETDMPQFAHRVHDLQERVFFENIKLRTSNSRIVSEVDSLV